MNSDRTADRRSSKEKYKNSNKRKSNRRKKDKLDQNVYKFIMIVIPLVLIIWAINLR